MLLEYFPEIFRSNHEHWRSTTRFYSPGPVGAIEPVIKGSVEVLPGRLDRVFKTQRGNPDWPEELEPNRSPNIGPNDPPGQKGFRVRMVHLSLSLFSFYFYLYRFYYFLRLVLFQ